MSEHKGSQGVYKRMCVCVIVCMRQTHQTELTKHTGHSLQGPVTIMTSNRRILRHTHNTHTQRLSHRLNILFSGNLFGAVAVAAAAVAVCAVVLVEICFGKELSNFHKMSTIDHHILPSYSVTSSTRRKSKTLCFQNSQIWRTVSGSKLASFRFVCVPCNCT